MTKKPFVLGRTIHLTADDKPVEENDPAGVKVLGGAGSTVEPEDVKKYGLDDSHRLVEEDEEGVSDAKGLVIEEEGEESKPKATTKKPPAKHR